MSELGDRIKDMIENEPVVLFMKGTPQFVMCGNSDRALHALREAGAPVTTVDILPDPAIRQELSAVSGWPTIPQVFVKGELRRRGRHHAGARRVGRAGADPRGEARRGLPRRRRGTRRRRAQRRSRLIPAQRQPIAGKAPTAVSVCSSASLLGPPSQRWRYGTRSNARSS